MAYEAGTTIIFDVIGKTAFIVFRDLIITLPGPYASQTDGIAVGEPAPRFRALIAPRLKTKEPAAGGFSKRTEQTAQEEEWAV